jgi:hypothetical protein
MKAKLFQLNARDFIRGGIVAVFSAIAAFLYDSLNRGDVIDAIMFKKVGMAALAALFGYLATNLITNSTGQILTKEK